MEIGIPKYSLRAIPTASLVTNYSCREPRIRGLLFSADRLAFDRYRPINFTVLGARFKLMIWNGQREIYQCDPDGIERFIGFEGPIVKRASADKGDVRSLGVA